jgi:hypothetical protein
MKTLYGLSIALAFAPAAPALGCGGCYVNESIVDVTVMPSTAPLEAAATPVDSCNGGYGITITNHATDDLVLATGLTVPAGSFRTLDEVTGDVNCPNDTCTVLGTLGTVSVTVRWVIQPG